LGAGAACVAAVNVGAVARIGGATAARFFSELSQPAKITTMADNAKAIDRL
jgi:hypothetical protein